MKLNLGLESLNAAPSMSKAEKLQLYVDIVEDFDNDSKYPMIDVADLVFASRNKAAAIETLCADPVFAEFVGNSHNPVEAVRSAGSAAMENLFQDFMRFGISGMIAGAILANLERIKKLMLIGANGGVNPDKKSVYLPIKTTWAKYKKAADAAVEAVNYVAKDPSKADFDKFLAIVGKGGSLPRSKDHVNWNAVSWNYFFGPLWGSLIANANEGTAEAKGWTQADLVAGCKDVLAWIDAINKFKGLKASGQPPHEIVKALDATVNALIKLVKNAGRGLSAIVSKS